MKKLIVVMLAFGMLFWVSGCKDSEKVIEGDVQNVVTGSENAQSQESDGAEENAKPKEEPSDNSSSAGSKGYAFTFQGTVVEVDADAAAVVEKLGEPVSYFEAPSCAFQGLDKIYTYNGFELDTYPVNDVDYISAIIFKDDSVATAEGVGIGDMREKLEQTYGSESTAEDGMLVYEKDAMKLCFILRGDEIISVEYRSTVLDAN